MSNVKPKAKKTLPKNVRNVLAQPYKIIWPLIPDNDFSRCSRYLKQVERKHIISGCNGVIKLLQQGQASAFFILDSFNPQIFAKLIIQMARKQNPSVLVLALPSFPVDCNANSTMMGIIERKSDPPSAAIQTLLNFMKDVSQRNGFIAMKPIQPNLKSKKIVPEKKNNHDEPMTEEDVNKLYIYESIPGGSNDGEPRRMLADSKIPENFISFSGNDDDSSFVLKPIKPKLMTQTVHPINQKRVKSSYIPLTINRVQGNPNRPEHKKRRRT